MLDDLVGVIETLQKRIRDHGATLRENETRTRMALIDPLLTALGWDVSDPAVVTPEYSIGDDFVDYALLGYDKKPVALVEAKRLGEHLPAHAQQLIGYCKNAGVRYGFLTDGDNWQWYDTGKANDAVIIRTNLSHEVVSRLLPLWRRSLAMPPTAPPSDAPTGHHAEPRLLDMRLPGWESLPSFSRPKNSQPPKSVRFPDGSESEIKLWRDLVVELVRWLSSNGLLTRDNLPVLLNPNSKRYIVSARAVHGTKSPFGDPIRIDGTRLSIDGKVVVGIRALDMAKNLLWHCGVDPADIQLQVGQ